MYHEIYQMPDETAYSPARLEEARFLLDTPMDALFEKIGKEQRQRGSPQDLIAAGKLRFAAITDKCRNGICKNPQVRLLCRDRSADHVTHLVCAISDTILHTIGFPVPATTVAVIIVQSGIESFCVSHWRES